jgi:hypothetical protein
MSTKKQQKAQKGASETPKEQKIPTQRKCKCEKPNYCFICARALPIEARPKAEAEVLLINYFFN